MLVVQVIVTAVCAAGLVWFSGVWRRGEPRGGAVRVPRLRARPLQVSAGFGVAVLLMLLLVPEVGLGAPAALIDFSYVAPLQYAAPVVAALVTMLGVPVALRQSAGRPRVSSLRPRTLTELIDRPTLAVAGPPLGALAVLACMLWQLLSSVDILWLNYTPTSNPSKRVQISERILGFPLSWQELVGLAVAVVATTVVAWTVLRRIRDAPASERGELSASDVDARRLLSRYVLSVATAAQVAIAGFALLSAGQFLQGAETSAIMELVHQDIKHGNVYGELRQIGLNRLQPEWALATLEVVLGVVLLLAAVYSVWQAIRVLRAVSIRPRAASLVHSS